MFFVGLFVLVHGVVKVGVIDMSAKALLEFTGGFRLTGLTILCSAFGVHRQHSVRRNNDPADQGDGPHIRR